MSLSTEFLDELRRRSPLSAIVGRTVKLKKAGNEWTACCPFHNEKTPSFYVNDEKEFYHCFGCGAHGDAIRWLTDSQGLEFLDAVRQLADLAGLEMPAPSQRDEAAPALLVVVEHAAAWFREQLMGLEGGASRAYLADRGVGEAAMKAFGLGFAPDSRSRLRSHFADVGDEMLIEAGLLAAPGDGREPYDRFRGRIIFPIRDHRGRTIAFGGRLLAPGEPKYLNSPETPLFDKGRTLFNLDRAAPAARMGGRLVVVEGYMDVIALAQVGINEAVAPLGTALTEAQLGILWRTNPAPLLCFDGDAAGKKAGARAALRALPEIEPGRSLQFVTLPAGKDPDDIARSDGAKGMEALFAAATPLSGLLWAHEAAVGPLTTPEQKTALRERLVAHARAIRHPDLAREYESDFRARVDKLFERPRQPAARRRGGRGKYQPPAPPREGPAPDADAITRKMVTAVIRGLARHPTVLTDSTELVSRLPVSTPEQRQAIELMLDAAFAGAPAEPAAIEELFPGERGWRGLVMSFHRAETKPARAEADLVEAMTLIVAAAEGTPIATLVQMNREYCPPDDPQPGRLL